MEVVSHINHHSNLTAHTMIQASTSPKVQLFINITGRLISAEYLLSSVTFNGNNLMTV